MKILPWVIGFGAVSLLFVHYFNKNTESELKRLDRNQQNVGDQARSETGMDVAIAPEPPNKTGTNGTITPEPSNKTAQKTLTEPTKVIYTIYRCNGEISDANLRDSPEGTVIGILPVGSSFTPIQNHHEWIRINSSTGQSGFIHQCFLTGSAVVGNVVPDTQQSTIHRTSNNPPPNNPPPENYGLTNPEPFF